MKAIVPLKDTYVKPSIVEIGDALFIDAPIVATSNAAFDSRQFELQMLIAGEGALFVMDRESGISTPYVGAARISIPSSLTSRFSRPCKLKWQLKLMDNSNQYTVAHGVIVLTKPLRGMNDGS